MEQNQYTDLVMQATSEHLLAEDWGINLQICDIVNTKPDESTRFFLHAIRRRLNNQNPKVQLLALTLFDTLVKNCNNSFFLQQAAAPEYFNEVQRLASGPADASVKEKAAECIREWSPLLGRHSGASAQMQRNAPSQRQQAQPQQSPIEKIKRDLLVVKQNIDMLKQTTATATSPDQLKQNTNAKQLISNCREMRRRLIRLSERLADDDILFELIAVNDSLNTAIEAYENFLKGAGQQPAVPQQQQQSKPLLDDIFGAPQAQPVAASAAPPKNNNALLSLDELLGAPAKSDNVVLQLSNMSLNNTGSAQPQQSLQPDDFEDEFAALATRKASPSKQPSVAPSAPMSNVIDDEFDALARRTATPPKARPTDDFDSFLNAQLVATSATAPQPYAPAYTQPTSMPMPGQQMPMPMPGQQPQQQQQQPANQVSTRTQTKLDKLSDDFFEL